MLDGEIEWRAFNAVVTPCAKAANATPEVGTTENRDPRQYCKSLMPWGKALSLEGNNTFTRAIGKDC